VAAFVLKYRLERDQSTPTGAAQPYKHDVHALADAQRAIRLVRMRAGEWRVRPDRVGIIGFSAGGVVSLLAAAHHDPGAPKAADPIERQSSRPDFFALIYAGTDAVSRNHGWSRETTPPAFLLCTSDDPFIDADELARLFVTLRSAGVSAELHLYSRGGHGFGVRNDRPTLAVSRWPARFLEWLGDRGFLE
jgi:endo-1,4-beta-xylanase